MQLYYDDPLVQIHHGHVIEALRALPEESIQMVMTSPPYWGLRNYGGAPDVLWGGEPGCEHEWVEEHAEKEYRFTRNLDKAAEQCNGRPRHRKKKLISIVIDRGVCTLCGAWWGQLGLEPSWQMYVEHLVEVSKEIWRVLRKDGSYYLVLGDTFAGSWGNYGVREGRQRARVEEHWERPAWDGHTGRPPMSYTGNGNVTRPKQKLLMPYRVAMALQEEGWILRDEVTWYKTNALPGSQKDRLTCTTERIFRFIKNDKTILWRNRVTGEWRDTKPTAAENYPFGKWENLETGEMQAEKPPEEEKDKWHRVRPLWMGFDHYFELDAIRVPHKSQSLKRASYRSHGDGDFYEGEGVSFSLARSRKELIKGGLFIKGGRPQSFNLRVRDVKRGKKGIYVEGGQVKELKASEDEVEAYQYPEKQGDVVMLHRVKEDARFPKDHLSRPPEPEVEPGRAFHPLGKNPGDMVEAKYQSKYEEADYGQPLQGFVRDQSIIKARERSRRDAKLLFPDNPKRQQEYINFIHDHSGHPQGKNPGDFWQIITQPFSQMHFAAFPEKLCETPILASSRPGDTVLDPFMGSGTTLVVAKKLGRKAIGIDIVESYCEIAKRRIEMIIPGMELK